MQQPLLEVLDQLKQIGFTEHIYHTENGWSHKGYVLHNVKEYIHAFWYDENDQRVWVYRIECGNIKGVGIM